MIEKYQLLLGTFCLVTLFGTGFAFNCYQCDSTLDSNCQENWDHSLSYNRQKYQPCNLWNAKFCIKATGMWGGVVGTHRFCSSRDLGDQCQDIWFPDHDRMYRACVYSCTADGCNGAKSWSSGSVIFIALFSALLAIVRQL
ncbi:U-scoloptoxin(05)-Sm1a [Biomphalaria pfeifferi]|uniref:U-scoloptoxin(05)-Sm1a n=1 Tax=Biomphalaria pfeifferi TaxID=112525 RepID=A0AAD8FBU4_BIOPF|nr:U-scoloptoxin(05)-Sm1a [Biomphalaria pfeifferi]